MGDRKMDVLSDKCLKLLIITFTIDVLNVTILIKFLSLYVYCMLMRLVVIEEGGTVYMK